MVFFINKINSKENTDYKSRRGWLVQLGLEVRQADFCQEVFLLQTEHLVVLKFSLLVEWHAVLRNSCLQNEEQFPMF